MDPAALSNRVTFQSPIFWRDADGQQQHGWRPEFTEWAHVLYKRGTEAAEQARMVSQRPVVFTVRASSQARRISSEWRAVMDGRAYDIREDPTPTPDRGFLQMLAIG